jgi:hypothetical protein
VRERRIERLRVEDHLLEGAIRERETFTRTESRPLVAVAIGRCRHRFG